MVKFLDDVTESHWVGLSETYLVMAAMKSMAWETLQKFFHFFKTVIKAFIVFIIFAPCLKN